MKKLVLLGLILSIMLVAGTAWAAKGTVGLGLGMAPDYEGSDDNEAVPMFMGNYVYDSGRSISLMGPKLKANLLASRKVRFGPVLNYRAGRSDVDNNKVDDMSNIDAAFEAGLFAAMDIDNFLLNLDVLFDVSDTHEGYTVQASAGYRWKASSTLTITPTVVLTGADGDYMDTYFSVDRKDANRSGLPYYNAGDGDLKDVGINVTAHYTPWEKWGIMGIVSYKKLLNDAKDTPIVDDEGNDKQLTLGVMATYRFGN